VRRRLQSEGGFGLIELLIAMTIMAIGISAIVAGFSSGILALNRANRTSTAGTLADRQMEAYRALPYGSIALSSEPSTAPYTPLTGDAQNGTFDITACAGSCVFVTGTEVAYCNVAPTTFPAPCTPVQSSVTGPDGHVYRVDTYIVWSCPLLTSRLRTDGTNGTSPTSPGCLNSVTNASESRALKRITVVVRDATSNPANRILFRETSTFDAAT